VSSVFIRGKDINDMWFLLLREVWDHGRKNKIDSGSFEKETYRLEFDFVSGTIEFPTTRPLSPIMPEGLPQITTDEVIKDYFTNYLMNSILEKNEHYKYATWVAGGRYMLPSATFEVVNNTFYNNRNDIEVKVPNQVEWCIKHFKEKGYGTNHCYIQVGYPESNFAYDKEYTNEMERGTSPCLRGIDLKIVEDEGVNKLLMFCYFRSWDLYAGWPENIGGLTMLMEYICEMLGDVEPGTLSFASKGLHCYGFQIETLKLRLGVE